MELKPLNIWRKYLYYLANIHQPPSRYLHIKHLIGQGWPAQSCHILHPFPWGDQTPAQHPHLCWCSCLSHVTMPGTLSCPAVSQYLHASYPLCSPKRTSSALFPIKHLLSLHESTCRSFFECWRFSQLYIITNISCDLDLCLNFSVYQNNRLLKWESQEQRRKFKILHRSPERLYQFTLSRTLKRTNFMSHARTLNKNYILILILQKWYTAFISTYQVTNAIQHFYI